MDVFLIEDHLVLRWGKSKRRTREYFRALVLDEGVGISDEQVEKGLRRVFFGAADFIKRMHGTYRSPQ